MAKESLGASAKDTCYTDSIKTKASCLWMPSSPQTPMSARVSSKVQPDTILAHYLQSNCKL